ncbi:MAG: ATP synthase subunit a 2 [Bacteroidia bacterium]|nr:MAG: ATP synthase subunit a 2 [Bacteroidia bacterium]
MIDSLTPPDSLQTFLADTSAVAAQHGEEFDFNHLLEHLYDSRTLEFPGGHWDIPAFPPVQIGGLSIDLSITKHVFFLLLAAVLLTVGAVTASRKIRKNPVPTGFANLVEVFVVFIRDEIVLTTMGPAGLKYTPFILTTFLYILIMNLLGLVPFGASATGNISVTAGLALVAFIMIQVAAIRAQGLSHYLAHFTGGVAWWLWPIMIPIEILGIFTKAFALCMRLFANMSGGHIVILALLGFIFLAKSIYFAPIPVVFVVAINLLEVLVAFIQAYVFAMLTALFMGLGIPQGEGEHGH